MTPMAAFYIILSVLYATLVVLLEWWVAHSKHSEVSLRHALAIGFVAILPALITTCSFVNKH
jgi:hypothetical protein